jgi:galactokinase
MPDDVAMVLLRSRTRRELVDTLYNQRREQCDQAARILGVPALGVATPAMVEDAAVELGQELTRRARHVTTENQRVVRGAELLEKGDVEGFGELMFESHASSRDDFENSSIELDALVELARVAPGCLGARLCGAGWGGASLQLVRTADFELYRTYMDREVQRHFGHRPDYLISRFDAGARIRGGA